MTLRKSVCKSFTKQQALSWSFVFCFIVMTIWSMLLVELVYPLIEEQCRSAIWLLFGPHETSPCQDHIPPFEARDYCLSMTSSVMNANLLLFKTVIAGDSWGRCAVPIILTLGQRLVDLEIWWLRRCWRSERDWFKRTLILLSRPLISGLILPRPSFLSARTSHWFSECWIWLLL